jgi:hypothetical protein
MTFTTMPKEAIRFKDGDVSINYFYNDEVYEYNPETKIYELSLKHFISDNEEDKIENYHIWCEIVKSYLQNFNNGFTENKNEDEELAFQLRWYFHSTFYNHPVYTLMNIFYQLDGEKYVQIPIIDGTISLINDEGKTTTININEEFQTNEWGDMELKDHIEFPCKKIDLFLIFQASYDDTPYDTKFGDEFYPQTHDCNTWDHIDYEIIQIYSYLGYKFERNKLYIQLHDEDDHENKDWYIYQLQHEVKVKIDHSGTYMKLLLDDDTEQEFHTQNFFDVYEETIAEIEDEPFGFEEKESSDDDIGTGYACDQDFIEAEFGDD